jgi:hypothetical protein
MNERWCILSPVYNDWDCATKLVEEIAGLFSIGEAPHVFFVDDGSNVDFPEFTTHYKEPTIIELTRNLGHQKAIAIGLSYIQIKYEFDFVVVIDSDGEDRPQNIATLIQEFKHDRPNEVIFAHRKRRHEGIVFKILYYVYRLLFRISTGQQIAFGNFCLIPKKHLRRVVHVSEIWNHFSGGIIRSKIPYRTIPVDRGKRYFGTSKMNFTALIIHGISSITVHLDVVSVRLLLASGIAVFLMSSGFACLLYFGRVIPTDNRLLLTSITLIMLVLFIIVLFMTISLTFNVLFYRMQRPFIPILEHKNFIHRVINHKI